MNAEPTNILLVQLTTYTTHLQALSLVSCN